MITVGVVGYGYWGPNLARNFAKVPGTRVVHIADLKPSRLAAARARYPGVKTSTDVADLIADSAVDAVVIATPVSTHYPIALAALTAGKHVLVEKPLTSSATDALRLIDEADRRDLVLMVDHTFVYTDAVMKMRELAETGDLGDIYYYDSVRINLGIFQQDVDVLWDLAVHDLSIMDHVLGRQAVAVSATGLAHVPGAPENLAWMTMFFDEPLIAHVHASWVAPVKVRRTLLGGSRKTIIWDDLEVSEKIKVYDRGLSLDPSAEDGHVMRVGYRTGDMWAPHLPAREALYTEALHFAACIRDKQTPITDGHAGLRVVRILEAATASMGKQGKPVELSATA